MFDTNAVRESEGLSAPARVDFQNFQTLKALTSNLCADIHNTSVSWHGKAQTTNVHSIQGW